MSDQDYENTIAHLDERIAELGAARLAYASEFDGDVGSIHENIRKLKAEKARLQALLGRECPACNSMVDSIAQLQAENAKLKQAARAFLGVRDYDTAEEFSAKRSALAALLGGEE